ncbi:MAG: ABC transporter substrate-binding protein, partial [Acidimicrobiia bacterium]|nr:ABC transporter substrate-binding protein [Acidimicrobiia bacterium]
MPHARWLFVVLATLLLAISGCSTEGADSTSSQPISTEAPAVSGTAPPATSATTTTAVELKPYGGEARLFGGGGFNPYFDHTSEVADLFTVGAFKANLSTYEFEPDVITETPTFANGGLVENSDGTLTVHYTIRPDAIWADRMPISGEDFAFTYEIAMDPETDEYWRDFYALVIPDSIEFGPKTFSYTLEAPTPAWQRLFAYIVPKHDVEGTDFVNDYEDKPWLSGGPFIFVSDEPDEYAEFVRNGNYWRTDPDTGQKLPYLDKIKVGGWESERVAATLPHLERDLHELAEAYIRSDPPCDDWDACIEAIGWDDLSVIEAAMYDGSVDRFLRDEIHSVSEMFLLLDPAETVAEVQRLLSTPG